MTRTNRSEAEAGADRPLRLRNFHITFFAIALGMAGFSLAVQKIAAEGIMPSLAAVATVLVYVTLAIFALVGLAYIAKLIRYPIALSEDLNHPVKINFFPLVAKTLLVLSIVFLARDMRVSFYFWAAGAVLQLVASIGIISTWIRHTHFTIEQMTPAWFIPIVGCLMVPIAGVPHGYIEISWFFFSVGLIFWLVLFAIVMYRLFFHPPIPEKLLPTLFILFAPPAIAFIAYSKLAGLSELGAGADAFPRILYYFSLFLLMLIAAKVGMFAKIRFYLSWWAYSFPLAAQTLATVRMFHLTENSLYHYLALLELGLLTLLVLLLLVRTINAIRNAEICVEE